MKIKKKFVLVAMFGMFMFVGSACGGNLDNDIDWSDPQEAEIHSEQYQKWKERQ